MKIYYKEKQMQVTNVRYSKTVQVNQYEPETIEATATLDEGESLESAVGEIRERVNGLFNGKAGTTESKVSSNKGTKTASKSKAKEPVEEESETTSGESKPAASKTTKKVTKKAAGKKAPAKKKAIPYDRSVGAHKKAFGQILHENYPDWKTDSDLGAAAKQASLDLDGEDFMDANGDILPTFMEAIHAAMGGEAEAEDEEL